MNLWITRVGGSHCRHTDRVSCQILSPGKTGKSSLAQSIKLVFGKPSEKLAPQNGGVLRKWQDLIPQKQTGRDVGTNTILFLCNQYSGWFKYLIGVGQFWFCSKVAERFLIGKKPVLCHQHFQLLVYLRIYLMFSISGYTGSFSSNAIRMLHLKSATTSGE